MRAKERLRYEVDPLNRLCYVNSGKESGVERFRTVLEGEFQSADNNTLSYRVKKPSSSIPQQVKLSGNWSLDKEHNLVFTLDKENSRLRGNRLTLQGEIIDAKAGELVFSLASGDSAAGRHFYLLKLTGKWQADKYNCLSFLVNRQQGATDTLTFSGSWEVNRQNELSYTYIRSNLKRKEKTTHTLALKGFWDITEKNRVSYVLNKELGSGFDFRASIGKPAARGMEYEIGIGAKGVKKKFTIFGAWKLNEKIGLMFEMPLEKGKSRAIIFGAACKLDKNYNLELKLKNRFGQDLGLEARLSRTLLDGLGEAYLQALHEGRQLTLAAGAGIRW